MNDRKIAAICQSLVGRAELAMRYTQKQTHAPAHPSLERIA